jgi:hypothetical protein
MLKLTSLALGLLTVIAIAPTSQAATNVSSLALQTPAGDLHSQVIIKLGGQPQYYQRGEGARRRELQRQRELEREREALRRRQYGGHEDKYHSEHRRDR